MAPRKGARKERDPMVSVSFHLTRSTARSISAPARNVSTTLPAEARKLIQTVACISKRFPPATPRHISISATEMPNRIEIRLASSAIPIHRATTIQTCSILTSLAGGYSRVIRRST